MLIQIVSVRLKKREKQYKFGPLSLKVLVLTINILIVYLSGEMTVTKRFGIMILKHTYLPGISNSFG